MTSDKPITYAVAAGEPVTRARHLQKTLGCSDLARGFDEITLLNTTTFVKTVKRQRAMVGCNG